MTNLEPRRCVEQLRKETRMKVLLSAEVRFDNIRASCRVLDISRGGACLEVDERARVGARVQFARGSLAAEGTVAWVRGRRLGVRFDAPIRATELLVQMSHSRQARGPAPHAAVTAVASGPSPSR